MLYTVNLIGQVINSQELDAYVATLKADWDQFKVSLGKTSKVTLNHVTQCMIQCLDCLIIFVNGLMSNESGANKKATVLAALTLVYEYIVVQTFPIWLKPFSSQIQNFIIGTLASIAIDWIVGKYNNGNWST